MSSKSEQVLAALELQLRAYFESEEWTGGEVLIERNNDLPEIIPAGGYINIFDGDAGTPDYALGFAGPYTYSHTVEIELWVADSNRQARDALYAALASGADAALSGDLTLGGEAEGMEYGAPAPITRPVMGGDDLKSAVLRPVIDYHSATRI